MPSFKAVRSFVAAAKYRNFTRAAEALCVTQAAISRQIRELEAHLGTELFERSSREVKLTAAGSAFFDAAQLSLLNIYQATQRIRREDTDCGVLTLCCSPAFSALCLGSQLADFLASNPGIELRVVTTQQFLAMEAGTRPDVFITKTLDLQPGYRRRPLFHEVVYPVCTPEYLALNPQAAGLDGLCQCNLLDLDPYGRAQMSEHVDWSTWLALQPMSDQRPSMTAAAPLRTNDYGLLMQLVLEGRGVGLGWHHLVQHLVSQGRLVRPVEEELVLRSATHYLVLNEETESDPACITLVNWLEAQFRPR
ncbi:MAG: LysR substrate-binding domain-containing protein [Pseudomonas sp.]